MNNCIIIMNNCKIYQKTRAWGNFHWLEFHEMPQMPENNERKNGGGFLLLLELHYSNHNIQCKTQDSDPIMTNCPSIFTHFAISLTKSNNTSTIFNFNLCKLT